MSVKISARARGSGVCSRAMSAELGLSGLCLVALLLGSAPVHAEGARDPAAAEELFRQGRTASEKRDFVTACAKFRESNRLDPAVGTVFNIADCEEKLGRFATSWTLFQEVAQRLARDDDRHAIAVARAQALDARVPRLLVHVASVASAAARDVQVRRDGVELGAASLDTSLPVDPGEHLVIVSAPACEARQFRVVLGEGQRVELEVSVGDPLPVEKSKGGAPRPPASHASSNHSAAYVVGGLGVAGLVTGVVAGLLVLDRKSTVNDQCADHVCSRVGYDAAQSGKSLGVVTTVGLITGALGLGASTYLFLSAPASSESSHSSAYSVGIRAKW